MAHGSKSMRRQYGKREVGPIRREGRGRMHITEMSKILKQLATLCAISVFWPVTLCAQTPTTIQAASCNEADVQSAITKATTDGDIVSIPAGNCTWTSTLNVTLSNSVTIRGAGAESSLAGGSGTTGSDQTIINDGLNRGTLGTGAAMMLITTTTGKSFRLTGVAFNYNNGSSNMADPGSLQLVGSSQAVRIDHCHFSGPQGKWIIFYGWIYGVYDHNVMNMSHPDEFGIDFQNGAQWNNDSVSEGDQSYADFSYWGSNKFFFVEDSIFTNDGGESYQVFANDCRKGGREVYRYNTFNGFVATQAHELAGDIRGCRAIEIYQNTWTVPVSYDMPTSSSIRVGGLLFWGNTTTEKGPVNLAYDRVNTFNGTFPGWGLCGQGYSGTVNTSGTSVTLVSGTNFDTNWPGDALLGFFINGTEYQVSSVASGTSLTLTSSAGTQSGVAYYAPSKWDQNTDSSGYACIDQPGRGKGDLLTGAYPNKVDSATGTVTWPNQALDPVYVWDNTTNWPSDSSDALVAADSTTIYHDNRDYFQQFGTHAESGSFNGTAGVGQGSLPPTNSSAYTNAPNCSNATYPGPGYWDTTNNTLYVCTALNTWTAYYTPYTYPHPLTTGTGPAPAAPTNLVVTSVH